MHHASIQPVSPGDGAIWDDLAHVISALPSTVRTPYNVALIHASSLSFSLFFLFFLPSMSSLLLAS